MERQTLTADEVKQMARELGAVKAGLGTLGLNLQLLTPEFGPRIILTAVLSSIPVETDQRMEKPLCRGPECGRCLRACPDDAVGHWDRDWVACDAYRQPHGFRQVTEFLSEVIDETDPEAQKSMLRNENSFYVWANILRGAGAVTGCRRCQDVCPVGTDYEEPLRDALEHIPEDTEAKQARLADMRKAEASGDRGANYQNQKRWIGS